MFPRRAHANGVPWLVWQAPTGWYCEGCGLAGELPAPADVAVFAKALGDLKRAHHGCRDGPDGCVVDGGVGHPLNPDRRGR